MADGQTEIENKEKENGGFDTAVDVLATSYMQRRGPSGVDCISKNAPSRLGSEVVEAC